MKDFASALADKILANESHKIKEITREVAEKIQKDMVDKTYALIDMYYTDYRPEVYIRTDELTKQKRGKGGKFKKKTTNERKRLANGDVSLRTAIKALDESGQPAIGICKPLDDGWGYQAGVLFDEKYFYDKMQHSVHGPNFTEWDIALNFLWGIHGDPSISVTTPAGVELDKYINTYKQRFDEHYQAAYKKYKNQ